MSSLLLSSVLSILLHAGGLAEYHITQNDDTLRIKLIIDQDELNAFSFPTTCDFDKTTAFCLVKYFSNNSTIIVNGKPLEFQLEGSSTENHHFILEMSTPLPKEVIKSIEIQNTCFTEFDPDFKNRMVLNIGKFQSSYLLNKKDSEVVIEKRKLSVENHRGWDQTKLLRTKKGSEFSEPSH